MRLQLVALKNVLKRTVFADFKRRDRYQVLAASKWIVAARLFDQFGLLLILAVTARFLSPEEYGKFALLSAPFFLVSATLGALWREAVISWRGNEYALSQLLLDALPAGLIATVFALSVTIGFGSFFVDDEIRFSASILAFTLTTAPLGEAFSALIYRRSEYALYAICILVSVLVGVAVTALLLSFGLGVFALAAALASQSWFRAAAMLFASKAQAANNWNLSAFPSTCRYMAHRFVPLALDASEKFVGVVTAGILFGPVAAGIYRAAEIVVVSMTELVAAPMRTGGLIYFRRYSGQGLSPQEIKSVAEEKFKSFLPLVFVVIVPVFAGLLIKASSLIHVFLGDVWQGAITIAILLLIARLLAFPTFAIEPVLGMVSKLGKWEYHQFVAILVFIGSALLLRAYDEVGVAMAAVISACYLSGVSIWLQRKYASVDWGLTLKTSLPAYCVPVVVAVSILSFSVMLPADLIFLQTVDLLGSIVTGSVAYFVILSILGPRLFDPSVFST
ncbi:MAG: oligosaccharide flippase family protein [Pseudomonadota bacterium]